MKIEFHLCGEKKIAEIISETIVIQSAEAGLALLGDLYYSDVSALVVHQKNIAPEFFDLKTGFAGELLQKFSNYRVGLAVVGDFSSTSGKSLGDFMRESNRTKQVNFVATTSEALKRLCD